LNDRRIGPWAAVALLVVCSVVAPARAAEQRAAPPAPYLDGLDLTVPAQETFRDWPSPALRGQAYWLPWGGSALQRASMFNRPIFFFLSVNWSGPSARMLAGPLADPRVLQEINRGFISVRVNADLRPDLRERYQTGTWPAIEFLLPNGNPMLSAVNDAGKDLPITSGATDRDSLQFLVREGAKYWNLAPGDLLARASAWVRAEGPRKPLLGVPDAAASDKVADWMAANADRIDGGFGAAPKYVVPFLVEYAALRADRGADGSLKHALLTLERILASPLFDPSAGGVRRLAAAPSFGELHPEKMLAGNASLIRDLTFAIRESGADSLRGALSSTSRFLVDVLQREGGGFYLAWIPGSAETGSGPETDRLVLSGPTVMAAAALLRAAAVLNEPEFELAALAALDFVVERGFDPEAGMRHALEPAPSTRVYLETLADTALGFLDAYESTGLRELRDAAKSIADVALRVLRDPESQALFDHEADALPQGLLANPRWPIRPNVRLARALIRLDLHGLRSGYRERALEILGYFCGNLSGFRVHGIEAAVAIEEAIAEPLKIRISGATDDARTRALRRGALLAPWAWTVVLEGEAAGPAHAVVSFGSEERRVDDPAALPAIIGGMLRDRR